MNHPFSINRVLSKTLAYMAKHSEETTHRNNACMQSLRDTIITSNRKNLLLIKEYLTVFIQSEAERNYNNTLIGLYLQLVEQQLKKIRYSDL
ncbi:hypothetical protein GXP67_06905 [Rhodocytophaga rosea]|uniref:Uncharacterized protein n=1 Tax=Rhodocytophaga rosea TaxID=2704465 RepID=A0A6C0GEL0_9BACT|nr:hypothetical protein [Rhodocytophaga rosea]QHT66406.1 hypothetical protein GXP67_06905 [Rhodocytophaga rosea]